MPTTWFSSATFLPYPGEPIDFLLEERGEPIHGTFANGMFQSDLARFDHGAQRLLIQRMRFPPSCMSKDAGRGPSP
jgi:hypothetical protein